MADEAVPLVLCRASAPWCDSVSLVSGVVGCEVWVLKEGRRSDVRDGDGGRGVGGRL